jgi:hypothetical protein
LTQKDPIASTDEGSVTFLVSDDELVEPLDESWNAQLD